MIMPAHRSVGSVVKPRPETHWAVGAHMPLWTKKADRAWNSRGETGNVQVAEQSRTLLAIRLLLDNQKQRASAGGS